MSRNLGWVVVCAAGVLAWAGPACGVPWGYAAGTVQGTDGGVSALAYASDGTLYLADSFDGSIVAVAPDGTRSPLAVSGATLVSVFGMWVSGDDSTLYVTDNKSWGDGEGDLYAVDVATGAAATLATGLDAIDDVAVRHTGEIFVSDASGIGLGGVYQVDPGGGGIVADVVTGLDYAAGLGFDPAGDLIYQQCTAAFAGEVYRLQIDDSGPGLSFGTPQLLCGGLAAAFALAVDGEGDVFVTGSGGVYELQRDAGGNFTGTGTLFDAHGYSTEIGFAPGSDPFEPAVGYDGGHLTFVPEYASVTLIDVTTVPEPMTLALLASAAGAWMAGRGTRRRAGPPDARPWRPRGIGPAQVRGPEE